MCKVRLLLLSALLLCFSIGAQADNSVTISSTEGAPDEEVTVSIAVQNSDALSSLQVSIPLDENLTLVEGSGQVGSRCSSHSLTVGVKDGVLNVFVYSLSMAAISGNSGEVASFKLKLGNVPQTVNLTPSKLVLTNSSGTTVDGSSQNGSVTTRCAKAQYSTMEVDFGRVPIRDTYHETLTVTNIGNDDLTLTSLNFSDVNVFSSSTTLPLTIAPSASCQVDITYSPTERGSITKMLKVECNSISKLNTIELKAQPFAVNELHVAEASGVSDETVTVHLNVNNMDELSGFQFEFDLPTSLQYVESSCRLSDRKTDHTIIATVTDGKLKLIAYSPSGDVFTGADGEIASFDVMLKGRNSVMLTPSKTVLSATIDGRVENVTSASYAGMITVKSPRISGNSSISMGAVPVTEECVNNYVIRNYGNAPLTVNRIVFNNENLSVTETLPIVIPAGGNKTVKVAYNSIEEVDFTGVMQIYSNDPDLRLMEVTVTGRRIAPNYIGVDTKDICTDDMLAMDVSVDNYDSVTGLQFDVVYPSQYYELASSSYVTTERAEGMTVTSRQIDNNTIRFFCYFLVGGEIASGDGKVMSLFFNPKEGNVPVGNYQVTFKNVKLGTQDMADKYAGTEVLSSFLVKERLTGDPNCDGKISIADVTAVINRINGISMEVFDEKAADVNGDGNISIADVTGIINIINE